MTPRASPSGTRPAMAEQTIAFVLSQRGAYDRIGNKGRERATFEVAHSPADSDATLPTRKRAGSSVVPLTASD